MKKEKENSQNYVKDSSVLHILLVAPTSKESEEIVSHIKKNGDEIIGVARDTKKAKELFGSHSQIDLTIIDLSLQDGVELYRSFQKEVFVIYLNDLADEKSIDKAIVTEPLCYLVKPINYKEFEIALHIARYKNSQKKVQNGHIHIFGKGFEFDHESHILKRGEKRWHLGSKKAQLLTILLGAKGHFVSFEMLERALYPEIPPGDSSLRTLIYRLRKLFDSGMIETQRNFGVRLV